MRSKQRQKIMRSTSASSCLFSSVSLTPIAEYGRQQSRVENNPKILRRKPQNPLKKRPISKREPQTKKPLLTKQELGTWKRSNQSLSSDKDPRIKLWSRRPPNRMKTISQKGIPKERRQQKLLPR